VRKVDPNTGSLRLIFGLAGGLLVAFVVIPLASTLLATSPAELGQTLADPEVIRSLGLTFFAAALATAVAIPTGLPLAYLLARFSFPGKRLVEGLVDLPVVIPHTAAGLALLLVWGSQGVLGQYLAPLGILFTDQLAGIVVAMLFVSLSFLVNQSREAFAAVDRELEQAALADGASHWQAFYQVTLPLAWRGVAAGALMMWARGISEFGAVVILAYHPQIVPTLLYERFEGYGLNAARPVAAVLILAVLAVFILLRAALLPEKK
jgi:molybdate/tungstate transport system permease protein